MSERPSSPLDGFEDLDKLLEHRVRLAVCVLLARGEAMTFSGFKELLRESDGNLGANLRRLEDEGYLEVRKDLLGRRPTSWYTITSVGRAALDRHVDALARITGGTDED